MNQKVLRVGIGCKYRQVDPSTSQTKDVAGSIHDGSFFKITEHLLDRCKCGSN